MKRIVRLTESDLARIVKRVMNEAATDVKFSKVAITSAGSISAIYAPGEVETGYAKFSCFDEYNSGRILSATVAVTPEGQKAGLTNSSLVFTLPASAPALNSEGKGKSTGYYNGKNLPCNDGKIAWTLTTPKTKWMNSTGGYVKLFTVTFGTSDPTKPNQVVSFSANANTQFGNPAASGQ